jgi:DNA-binding NarL/FixJ family response regulator
MSALTALPRNTWQEDDSALSNGSLERLVLVCLESLASMAGERGQPRRAARLRDAADLLREEGGCGRTEELSEREWEVASLIADGQSNRQIAAALVLSERTVDSHVSHILRKLSLNSRAHIAAWVVQQLRPLRVIS